MRSLSLLLLCIGTASAEPALELVETAPVETSLDHADLREAADVWVRMIDVAREHIELSEYYATSEPGSRLEPVIAALARAGARGVKVRMIVDAAFARHEAATVERLEKLPGVVVHRYDWAARGGGVLHAKYFVIDGTELFLGSQNFDWRSLTHVQELGVRVRSQELAAALDDVFETDWRSSAPRSPNAHHAVSLDGAQVTFVASPRGWLTDESAWDLPRLVALIASAQKHVRVQLLTYSAGTPGHPFDEIEKALRAAAVRGVHVELLVSNWCTQPGLIEGLQRLSKASNVTIKILSLPVASSGFIPYARVAHAKYLVVDAQRAWIGTSNWERDYFYASRNVGLIIDGGAVPPRLDRFFSDAWSSAYAAVVDPARTYVAPRIH